MAAAENSFDVVSQFDRQELVNAIDQATREIRTRYDLKDTKSTITLDKESVVLSAPSEFVLGSVRDLLESKVVRRGLSLKILDYGTIEQAGGNTVRQTAKLREGIDQNLAKQISKLIRDEVPKVKSQIQGDAVRVSGKSRDDLQAAIKLLKAQDYPVDLQFINYR